MQVGLNWWAFNHYGKLFGAQNNPQPAAGAPHWRTTLPANLRLFKAMGVSVVRWFVLGNGVNYGPAPAKIADPVVTPLTGSSLLPEAGRTTYSFTPPAVPDPLIVAHFVEFLGMFQHQDVQGMKVIPSFIDFKFCTRPDLDLGGGGRADVIVDTAKRAHFLNTMLQPLLVASLPFAQQIYAWEVMNEPVHLTMPINPHVGRTTPVPTLTPPGYPALQVDVQEPVLASFLTDALSRINAMGFASTVGHRFYDDMTRFPTGTRQQYHYYAKTTPVPIPGVTFDPNPIPQFGAPMASGVNHAFVGEIGARIPGEYPDDHGNLWPELNTRDNRADAILYERLTLLKQKGYGLALIWPETHNAGADDVLSKLSRDKIKGLIRFTGGSFPGI